MERIYDKKVEIYAALQEIMEVDDIREDSIFEKDSMDSFTKMNLLVLLEEISNCEISIVELFECHQIKDVIRLCLGEEYE